MPPDPSSYKSGNEDIVSSGVGVIDLTHSSDSDESAESDPEASGYTAIPQSQNDSTDTAEYNAMLSDDETSEVLQHQQQWANFVEEPTFQREWNVVEPTAQESRRDALELTDGV